MENTGWIKLNRKMLDNPIVMKDSDYCSVWCLLLLLATHTEIPKVFKGKKITLQPGQLITGRKWLANKLKIDEYKIQRILKCYESEHQIAQQMSTKNRLITILNWHEYQNNAHQNEQPLHNKCTTNAHIQECKNNYIYFIKKYKEQNCKSLKDKMRFLREIKDDEKYKELSDSDEYELRNLILGETNI